MKRTTKVTSLILLMIMMSAGVSGGICESTERISYEKNIEGSILRIDAQVQAPEMRDLPALYVRNIQWTEDELNDVFFHDSPVTMEHYIKREGQLADGEIPYRTLSFYSEDGRGIYANIFGMLSYYSGSFSVADEIAIEAIVMDHATAKAFEDFTSQEAMAKLIETAKKLRLEPGKAIQVVPIDRELLLRYGSINGDPKDLKASDGYWIRLELCLNGNVCYPNYYFTASRENPILGSSISAYITKDGVQFVSMIESAAYEVVNEQPISSGAPADVEQALSWLENWASNLIVSEPLEVYKIQYAYVPVPVDDMEIHFMMKPSWCFYTKSKVQLFDGTMEKVILFDAYTGDEIY